MSSMDFSSSNPDNFGIAGSTAGTGTPGGQTGQGLVNDPTAPTTTRDHRLTGSGTATGIQAQSTKWDPTEGGEFNSRQPGLRDPYRDNTSGFTTRETKTGTGGSGFNSDADQQFQARQPVSNQTAETEASDGNHPFDRTDFGNERQQSSGTGANKPSISDRLKGSVQMAAGKVSGNQAMVERGEERKLGENAGGQY